MSRIHRTSRGAALPAALVLVAVAAAVSAALATLAQSELLLARARDASARAMAAADGCVAAVVADLPAGWGFDGLLAGADGVTGTADDGARPAPAGCTASVAAAPGPADPPRALLRVEAVAGDGRRVVEAIVARTAEPAAPLLWLAESASLRDLGGSLTLDAADDARPSAPVLAPLGAPDDPGALDSWLGRQAGRLVLSPAGAASVRWPPVPVAELVTRMRDAGAVSAGTLTPAGTPPLTLTLVTGDLVVGSTAAGRGLLVVTGLLDIQGSFQFSGVVVASAGIRVAAAGRLDVAGSLWLGAGALLVVDGDARVVAQGDALDAADGLLRLPRRAILASLRDPP